MASAGSEGRSRTRAVGALSVAFTVGTASLSALHDVGVGTGDNTRCGRERILTETESAIRARFVRDSFHYGTKASGTDDWRSNLTASTRNTAN